MKAQTNQCVLLLRWLTSTKAQINHCVLVMVWWQISESKCKTLRFQCFIHAFVLLCSKFNMSGFVSSDLLLGSVPSLDIWATSRENVSLGFWTRLDSNLPAQLEAWNFGYSKYKYYTIKAANNKGADQTAWMRRLICAFVVRIWN